MEENYSGRVFSGFIWKLLERLCAQGITFLVTVVLARLLAPEVYAPVAIIMVFIGVANVFITGGLANALIRKKGADEADFSTIFWCSAAIALTLYLLMYFTAPLVAAFYDMPELTGLMRVLSVHILISGYSSVQHAYVARHMIFRKFFYSTIVGTLISGVVGILMALGGWGVWALVAQYLTNSFIDSVVLSFTVNWHPRLIFSRKSCRELIPFGTRHLAANLIGTIYTNLRALLIGKFYAPADLAYYNKGKNMPALIADNLSSTFFSVLFPAIANAGDNLDTVRRMTCKSYRLISFLIMPSMIGMAVVARPMVILLFTEKWLGAVPYLQIACIYDIFSTITTASLQPMNAMGRSDVVLRLEFIKKPVALVLILVTLPFGPLAVALSLPAASLFSMVVNVSALSRLLHSTFWTQARELLPTLLLSLLMAAVIWPVSLLHLTAGVQLLLQIPLGMIVYVAAAILTKNSAFFTILDYLKSRLLHRK